MMKPLIKLVSASALGSALFFAGCGMALAAPSWSIESVDVSPASGASLGQTVDVSIKFAAGSNTDGLTYNFAWRKDPGWSVWGSDLLNGAARGTASASLSLPECGSYELWFDVIDAAGNKTTIEAADSYSVSLPYEIQGFELSSSSILLGDSISVSPQISGDSNGLQYNYAWGEGTGWSNWGSTRLSTGGYSTEPSWEFTPTKPGTYRIWMDVKGIDGSIEYLASQTVTVGEFWSVLGASVSPANAKYGEAVSVSIEFAPGSNTAGLSYNFAWRKNPGWQTWDSDLLKGGARSQSSACFVLPGYGDYTLWFDVIEADGSKHTYTASDSYQVAKSYSVQGLELSSSSISLGDSVTMTPLLSGDTSGVQYNYVWRRGSTWENWGSTRLSTGAYTTDPSWDFSPTLPGLYRLWIDVVDPDGSSSQYYRDLLVKKDGGLILDIELEEENADVEGSVGKIVSIKPVISGSTQGLSYTYMWMQSNWASFGVIAQDTADTSVQWAPPSYGTYTLIVQVSDGSGVIDEMSVSKWFQRDDPYNGAYQNMSSDTNYLIVADSSSCKLTVYRGSQGDWMPIRYWDCSPGAPATPTPNGVYKVTGRGYSFGATFSCYYYTQFWGDYLIHSGTYVHNTLQVLDDRMGVRISHGCVRLLLDRAKWVYDTIPNGSTVLCIGA